MKPRSLVFDLFGDYLRYRDPEIPLRSLVRLLEFFDIPGSTTRVVASRMRKEGWLTSRRVGRESLYRLTDEAWALLDQGRDRIFHENTVPWSGTWHMVIYSLPESQRALRSELRKQLAWLGYGPIGQSVWISPHDRGESIRSAFDQHCDVSLDFFATRSEGLESDLGLAARAWNLQELANDYSDFVKDYQPSNTLDVAANLAEEHCFVRRMRLVHDYRSFPFRDPNLPAELLPNEWSGHEAFRVFVELHQSLQAQADRFVDDVLDQPL